MLQSDVSLLPAASSLTAPLPWAATQAKALPPARPYRPAPGAGSPSYDSSDPQTRVAAERGLLCEVFGRVNLPLGRIAAGLHRKIVPPGQPVGTCQ
ncbi:MAG: hypothetical protein JWM88_3315 [Verrucomicrobia bacterium]|nr:hypothetical protein [Verrucomicrobiota bacterium]